MSTPAEDRPHGHEALEGHVVLVVNAGSSSIKCSVYRVVDDPHAEGGARAIFGAGGQIESIGVTPRIVARMADGRLIVPVFLFDHWGARRLDAAGYVVQEPTPEHDLPKQFAFGFVPAGKEVRR